MINFALVKILLIYIFSLFAFTTVQAQQNDSITTAYKNDSLSKKRVVNKAIYSKARKATIMSACLPGLGQLYNKKYWKTPVILAAIGGISYWGITNHNQYKFYSKNLKAENDGDASTLNSTNFQNDKLILQKNYYKKYRDIAVMAGLAVYFLNIIDANVDAHLKTFDVSDDLSLQIKPYSNIDYNNTLQTGVSFKLNFK